MLTAIREGSKGWLASIVIGLIVLTFALWGIGSYFEGGAPVPVATVNGEEIDVYTFQNRLSRQRQLLIEQYGSGLSAELMASLALRQRVLDDLIEARLLDQYTQENNYRLTDQQVAQRIRTSEVFHRDGRFDPALYERLLQSNGLSPQAFEDGERQVGMNRQLLDAVTESSFLVESEVSRLIALQNQLRETQYAIIPADLYVDAVEISPEEIRAQYDDHIEQYRNPARIKVEYIDFSVDAIAADTQPSDEEIAQTYERIKERLKTAEVRQASHILISVEADTEPARAEALAKAESVMAQAQAGVDFAELAREHSDDPGSAANGGALGVINRGQMVAPFEDAVFAMAEGELRGPVATRFGYHVLKLTELQAERQRTLEDAQEEVVEEARKVAAESIFSDLVEPFDNAVFEQPESLEAAADVSGFEIKTSDWFTEQAGTGIAEISAVRAAAFSPDVRDEGLNSPIVEVGFDRMVALRKLAYEEAFSKPFEAVREEIATALKREKSRAKAEEMAAGLLDNLTHLASWDIMLARNEWQAHTLPEVRHQIPPHLSELANRVYATPIPRIGKPQYGQAVLTNGDVAIYALTAVTPGDVETVDVDAVSQLEQMLVRRDGDGVFDSFMEALKAQAEIVVHTEQLEQL